MSLKKCPYCAEEIQAEAILCEHCQMALEPEQTTAGQPVASQSNEMPEVVPGTPGDAGRQKTVNLNVYIKLYLVIYGIFTLRYVFTVDNSKLMVRMEAVLVYIIGFLLLPLLLKKIHSKCKYRPVWVCIIDILLCLLLPSVLILPFVLLNISWLIGM